MKKRVVITGLGIVTPLGIGKRDFWSASLEGRPAIGPITRFDCEGYPCRLAGEVKNFEADKYVDRKIIRQTDRSTQMAMAACSLALEDSGMELKEEDPGDVGMYFANLFGGMEFAEPELYSSAYIAPQKVSAYQSIAWFYAAAQGQWSISRGIRGYGKSIVADRAGGLQAIGWASKAIQLGHCTMAFAGGFEAPLTPYSYLIHMTSGLLATARNGLEPKYTPFDRSRNGCILGEGAAIVLLEEKEHAIKRGAHIYCELAGFSITRGQHSTNGEIDRDSVSALARCFVQALSDSNLQSGDVGFYCADGIAQKREDREELEALVLAFPDSAKRPSLSAPKCLSGHLLSAAGALDIVWTSLMMEERILLPTASLAEPEEDLEIDYVLGSPQQKDIYAALCCNRGIDDLNSAVILKKF